MKKGYIILAVTLLFVFAAILSGCKKNTEELSENTSKPSTVFKTQSITAGEVEAEKELPFMPEEETEMKAESSQASAVSSSSAPVTSSSSTNSSSSKSSSSTDSSSSKSSSQSETSSSDSSRTDSSASIPSYVPGENETPFIPN